ncbi:MAG: AMP-binding protein, partial [Myxococcales bacterium]|nr:AMP-binding protein [Myxococcales bacterium]
MADSPLLAGWAARASDRGVALREARGATGWPEIVAAADRVASGLLRERRSLEGERVALLVSPGSAFVAGFFGVLRAGGTAVVLSPLHPPPETAYLCEDAGVRTILVSADQTGAAAHLAPGRTIAGMDALLASPAAPIAALPRARDPALQLYTSGTTAKPKGAIIRHANIATQQELLRDAWSLGPADVLLLVLPLHHMHGLCIALL